MQRQTTIRMDEEVKQQFEEVLNTLGLSVSTAITLFAKATIRHRGIPFPVTIDPLDFSTERERVQAELRRRLDLADAAGAKWLSTEDVKKELGL